MRRCLAMEEHSSGADPCCRIAGHTGPCCRHFVRRLALANVHMMLTGSGRGLLCAAGENADLAEGLCQLAPAVLQ